MKIYEYPSTPAEKRITSIVNRALGFKKKDILTVTRILEDVRKNGDTALIKFTNRFDSPALTVASIKATPQEIDTAASKSRPSINSSSSTHGLIQKDPALFWGRW
jgi:histidinol dehydrogenase